MESDHRIEDLIEELKALRVRETAIIQEIEAVNELRIRRTSNGTNQQQETNDRENAFSGIRKGDRVRITNKIRRPATAGPAWTEQQERTATVTRVTAKQIHIVTDNGTRTWRGPNNLRIEG